jgi:hypothetical protein
MLNRLAPISDMRLPYIWCLALFWWEQRYHGLLLSPSLRSQRPFCFGVEAPEDSPASAIEARSAVAATKFDGAD